MNKDNVFAMVPLRGVSLFPGMTLHFDVGRRSSLAALKNANGQDLFFITQKDVTVEKPEAEDLYSVGVVGTVRQIIKLPDHSSTVRVVVEGKYRAKIDELITKRIFYKVSVSPLFDDITPPAEYMKDGSLIEAAALFSLKNYFDDYAEFIRHMTPEMFQKIYESKNLGELSDYIAGKLLHTLFIEYKKNGKMPEKAAFIR